MSTIIPFRKPHKYHVADKDRRTVDGIVFDSLAEASRYAELRMLESLGHISDLKRQPSFVLQPAFTHHGKRERAIVYRGDFSYLEPGGNVVVEDVKGVATPVYKLKQKMLLFKYPDIDFREVKAR